METTRREALGALVLGGLTLAGCNRAARKMVGSPSSRVALATPDERLLNRTSFGPTDREAALLRDLGREAYAWRLLAAEEPEDPALSLALGRLDVLRLDSEELRELPDAHLVSQVQQAALLRAIYGNNALRERMTDVWSDHFNLDSRKKLIAIRMGGVIDGIVRQEALGSFPKLLREVTRSAAMLTYLDNTANRAGAPNENLARELLELHSLGVDGGYSQKDVQEVARCLTGWTVENRFLKRRGQFRFDESIHDVGAKRVLGHVIPAGGGVEDGEQVLEIISKHPATARRVATKLTAAILGEEDPKVVSRLEAIYAQSQGSIAAMLEPLLAEVDLVDRPPILKRPYDFVASAARESGATVGDSRGLQSSLRAMGQPLYEWPRPDGFPTSEAAWVSGMLARWNFAYDFAHNNIPGVEVEAVDREALALQIASPEFQWR